VQPAASPKSNVPHPVILLMAKPAPRILALILGGGLLFEGGCFPVLAQTPSGTPSGSDILKDQVQSAVKSSVDFDFDFDFGSEKGDEPSPEPEKETGSESTDKTQQDSAEKQEQEKQEQQEKEKKEKEQQEKKEKEKKEKEEREKKEKEEKDRKEQEEREKKEQEEKEKKEREEQEKREAERRDREKQQQEAEALKNPAERPVPQKEAKPFTVVAGDILAFGHLLKASGPIGSHHRITLLDSPDGTRFVLYASRITPALDLWVFTRGGEDPFATPEPPKHIRLTNRAWLDQVAWDDKSTLHIRWKMEAATAYTVDTLVRVDDPDKVEDIETLKAYDPARGIYAGFEIRDWKPGVHRFSLVVGRVFQKESRRIYPVRFGERYTQQAARFAVTDVVIGREEITYSTRSWPEAAPVVQTIPLGPLAEK